MNYTVSQSTKRYAIVATIGICIAALYAYTLYTPQGPIYDFEYQRDAHDIITNFNEDIHWLTESKVYTPEYMIKYKSPTFNPMDVGKLTIKLLRLDDNYIGFTAYYMKTPTIGHILFLHVNKDYRGKRYAQQLLEYGIQQLKKQGAVKVILDTRVNNYPGQKLYVRTGFKEIGRDDTFINYEIIP